MNFCSHCGQPVTLRVPEGDNRPRHVCASCGTIHYRNPKVVVGCVAEWQGRILICRRAIEPRLGYWTIPAGFLENGETLHGGAERESREEALARVEIASLLAVVDVLYAEQVHITFRAALREPKFGVGDESLEVKLVEEAEIPWKDIAFASVDFALRRYFSDRAAGLEGLHFTEIARRPSL
ncbi:MAG: NUDIX hydrolase [Steroidobacteraceae bacterium]